MQEFVNKVLGEDEEIALIEQGEENNAEVAVFELIDRQGSGFIRIGTEKMPEPDEIDVAGYRQILAKSAFRQGKGKKDPKTNLKTGPYDRIAIRYRADSDSIMPAEQDEANSAESYENDRIVFKNGRIVVINEGLTKGLFAFLRHDSRNVTNPKRIPGVKGVYREIFPERENENDLSDIFTENAAVSYVESLITDKTPGKFQYDENRLIALCQYWGVVADSNGSRLKSLVALAKHKPAEFLQKSQAFEEQTMTEIAHAVKLGVIKFEANRVTMGDKVLFSFSDKLTEKQKYNALSGFFQTHDGDGKYREFAIELSAAKKRLDDADGAGAGGQK